MNYTLILTVTETEVPLFQRGLYLLLGKTLATDYEAHGPLAEWEVGQLLGGN